MGGLAKTAPLGLVGGLAGDLFKAPKQPAIPEPAEIPDVDDESVRRARRRSLAASQARSGTRSTIRTEAGGALGSSTILGGDTAGRTVLGG
jgi:hypothetical protein